MRTLPFSSLHWHRWNDEYVVYDELSGGTHLLDFLTACALLRIEDGITDTEALVLSICEHTSLTDRSISEALPDIFEQLIAVALIETIPE